MFAWDAVELEDSDMGFDMDTAVRAVEHYSRAAGIGATIIDTRGRAIKRIGYPLNGCRFCTKVQGMLDSKDDYCEKVHLYGGYQAERFGGKYIFFCPMGLVHWASPIASEGVVRGYLLGGPAMMVNPEDFLIEDLLLKNHLQTEDLDDLKESLEHIPIVPPDRVTSLSEMLFMTAIYISDAESLKYPDETKYNSHPSDVSRYLQGIKTMGGNEPDTVCYPFEKERELLSYIAAGDKKSSQTILNEVLGHIFFSSGGDFETIRARVLELVVLLSRAAMEGGADAEQIFGLNYKYLNTIHDFKSVEELTYWLSKIMVRFTDCVFNFIDIKHVDVIYKAVNFINNNYMNKITLEEVASHVYLSPSYFSKVFKDEMDCNFNTYVNQVRVERSKGLLLGGNTNLVDIANMVGFEDQSYFSKIFKRVVGISPGRFRRTRGQYNLKEAE